MSARNNNIVNSSSLYQQLKTNNVAGGTNQIENENVIKTTLYTLNRGERLRTEEVYGQLQGLLDQRCYDDMERLIRDTPFVGNFGGIMYSVRFRTNRPIILTSLGFWGPATGRTCAYKVNVIISEFQSSLPTYGRDTHILGKVVSKVEARPNAIFQVPLRDPVHLEAYKWIRIQFQLNGDDTYKCASVRSSYFCEDSNVNFEFLDSSHQLPLINYVLH